MANTNSALRARTKIYSDLDISFRSNPNTDDVVRVYDLNAVRQSVTNIIRTRPGEKPFLPYFGCNLESYLFELFTPQTRAMIINTVRIALENYEPRIALTAVDVYENPDRNAIDVIVDYVIKSPEGTADTVKIIVERLR